MVARIRKAKSNVVTPTVSDPKLQVHVDAINKAYELFTTALASGDIATAMKESDEGERLSQQFPEAWAIAAKAHGVDPATMDTDDGSSDLDDLFE